MATFQENIKKIRGDAIYGVDVREAIAEALTQCSGSMDDIDEHISERVEQLSDDWDNKIQAYTLANAGRANEIERGIAQIKREIEDRDLFIACHPIGADEFNVKIRNAG